MSADERNPFEHALVRMLQSGAYQEWLGCPDGACAKVEFRLQQVYHVDVGPRQVVIKVQDMEAVRRQRHGNWTWLGPTARQTRRIVLDQASGRILETPTWGRRQAITKPAASDKPQRQKRNSVVIAA